MTLYEKRLADSKVPFTMAALGVDGAVTNVVFQPSSNHEHDMDMALATAQHRLDEVKRLWQALVESRERKAVAS